MKSTTKININDHRFSTMSVADDVGRVFFVGKRVFRAIEEHAKEDVLLFLNSECYRILREKRLIVDTWVTEDVKLDGYSLILEHEYLFCYPSSIWTPSQLIEGVKLLQHISEICAPYGWYVKDGTVSNITFIEGMPIFIDFGSFIRSNESPYFVKHITEGPLTDLLLYLRGESYMQVTPMELSRKYPRKDKDDVIYFKELLHPIIKYYDVYIKKKWKFTHVRIRTFIGLKMVEAINRCIYHFTNNKVGFFKIKKVYKDFSEIIKNIELSFESDKKNFYDIDNGDILKYIPENAKSVLLYGNYKPDDIKALCQRRLDKRRMCCVSSDINEMDRVYKSLRGYDVFCMCTNIFYERTSEMINLLQSDLLVIQNMLDVQIKKMQPLAIANMCSKYAHKVLMPYAFYNKYSDAFNIIYSMHEIIGNGEFVICSNENVSKSANK